MSKTMVGFIAAALFVLAQLAPAFAVPGGSGDGGNNGNHTGTGGGGSHGHGGGDGGRGGDGGHGGHGGGHGHGHGGGHHGGGHGGGSSPSVSAPAPSTGGPSATGGAYLITGGAGISKADRDALIDAVKACEMERPGLAIGDTTVYGGWSFLTADDSVWPYVQRCMKARGYPAYGVDYSDSTNFGRR